MADHRLLFELGRGGMGTVFLAVAAGHDGAPMLRVIKRLNADIAGESEAVRLFFDEARICARLHHPNVVETFRWGFDGRYYFLEMEYLEGRSLDTLLRRGVRESSPPLGVCVFILTEILAGLHYAHELTDEDGAPLGLVHRDVSPHNVLVTYDGAVRLLDFGIAKVADSTERTRSGFVRGKATYMAPEQAARAPLDRRADLFAVGVILWQMLARRRLWADRSDVEIFDELQRGDLPLPSASRGDLPPELERICMKALARAPRDRFATAAALRDALLRWLDANGPAPSQADVARVMNELFGRQREAARARIAAQIERGSPDDSAALEPLDVGMVSSTPSALPRKSTAPTRTDHGRHDEPEVRRRPRAVRGRVVVIAAVVAAALGVVATAAVQRLTPAPAVANTAVRAATMPSACARDDDCRVDSARCVRAHHCAVAPECATNADCAAAHRDAPFVCSAATATCVPVARDGCDLVGDARDVSDGALVLGALYPLTGPNRLYGQRHLNAIALAAADFTRVMGGAPRRDPLATPRDVRIVACDDATEPERGARHLVDDLDAPVVFGFGSSREATDLATRIFVPRGVLVVPTLNTAPQVTKVPTPPGTPRLVWRATYDADAVARAAAAFVPAELEGRARAFGRLRDSERIRIALVRANTASSDALARTLIERLRFNARAALENGLDFQPFVYDDDAPPASRAPALAKIAARLAALRPQIVLLMGGDELVDGVVRALDRALPSSIFFDIDGLDSPSYSPLFRERPKLRERVLGMSVTAATAPNTQFVMHYNEQFSPPLTRLTRPGSYDAAYLAIFASTIAPNGALRGVDLANAMPLLGPPGERFAVGPAGIAAVTNALRAGQHVELDGALGRLVFDASTGELPIAFVLTEPAPPGASEPSREIGIVYRDATGVVGERRDE